MVAGSGRIELQVHGSCHWWQLSTYKTDNALT